MKKPFLFITPFLVAMLAACMHVPQTQPPDTVSEVSHTGHVAQSSTDQLFSYLRGFIEWPPEVQKSELAKLNQELSRNKTDVNNRMKLAMLYAAPTSRIRDESKAQVLLDELQKDKNLDNSHKALVNLLRDFLQETGKHAQKSRDEQKRADALQQKLDELKNIEKTMVDRDQGVRK